MGDWGKANLARDLGTYTLIHVHRYTALWMWVHSHMHVDTLQKTSAYGYTVKCMQRYGQMHVAWPLAHGNMDNNSVVSMSLQDFLTQWCR